MRQITSRERRGATMKQFIKFRIQGKGLMDTIIRFPLTIFLLFSAVITNTIAINIQVKDLYIKLFISMVLGASIYVVSQMLYERFCNKPNMRIILMAVAFASSTVYYLLINNAGWSTEVIIRTIVIFFILLIAFLWIPVIRNDANFNQSFISVFKSFFMAAFLSGILFLGVWLIIGAINMLITSVDGRAYPHAANIIFVLITPIYFLSLIPIYPKREKKQALVSEQTNQKEAFLKATSSARFLEILISYIVIPVAVVFTVILLLYIFINITGDFWTNNLMEPLLLSYSITVIIVYLLASNMRNTFARYFRKAFPKVLVPVVLFQTLSSILKMSEVGVTYGRYFVILFGLFATVAAILFCVMPIAKNGIIAPILIILSAISIIPPSDAFTISRINQIGRLENALKKNEMLKDNVIIPNEAASKEDQKIIISSIQYLNRMNYVKDISWLSAYQKYYDYAAIFGFTEFEADKNNNINLYIYRDRTDPITVSGYDFMIERNIDNQGKGFMTCNFEKEGIAYNLRLENADHNQQAILLENEGKEIIRFELNSIFNKYYTAINNAEMNKTVSTEEVTFTQENISAVITVIAQDISINEWKDGKNQYANVNILIKIK